MTGRYGIDNGVETHGKAAQSLNNPATQVDWAGSPDEQIDTKQWWTLPELFFKNGIPAIGIGSFPQHPAPWFYHVWHEYHQPQSTDPEQDFQAIEGEHITSQAIDILERVETDNFYLYFQLWDPHVPYNRTEEEIEQFRSVALPPYPTTEDIRDHQEWDAWRSASHMRIDSRADLNEMLSHYDAEIHYADDQVGQVLDRLKSMGLYDEATIVLTGDHGEEFGEHGLYREHWSTYEGTQHVPLIVKPPFKYPAKNGVCSELVTNVDIAPTIADFEELEQPEQWQGRSLCPLIEENIDKWRDYIVIDHGLYTAQRAVRTDRWKYIRTLHPGMWGGKTPEEQLYDLQDDPWEQHDLIEIHRDIADKLAGKLERWVNIHCRGKDPLKKVAQNGPSGYNAFEGDWSGI